jgi:hypothetical protein
LNADDECDLVMPPSGTERLWSAARRRGVIAILPVARIGSIAPRVAYLTVGASTDEAACTRARILERFQ